MSAKPTAGGPAWKKDGSGSGEKRLPLVPIIVGVVLLLAVIAVVATSVSNEEDDATSQAASLQQTAPVTVSGEPLEELSDGEDPAVGSTAPSLRGQTFDGTTIEIADDGRPKVLVFLAHWCPHCQAEVPRLVEWMDDNGVPEDVDVYGVATGTNEEAPNFPPSAWLQEEEWELPTLADSPESDASAAFGLSSYPFFVALDADHNVVARGSGELSMDAWESLLDLASA